MSQSELIANAFAAFAAGAANAPLLTLLGGNALDEYKEPPPFNKSVDALSDAYWEQYHWGIGYLDAASWRHVLPHLIEYALRHLQKGSSVTDAFLNSLRPPDRVPPRLASLSSEQKMVVTRFLDVLAFSSESAHQDLACQVFEVQTGAKVRCTYYCNQSHLICMLNT